MWSVKDVADWVRRIGFESYVDAIRSLQVDGDLLLHMDEPNLKDDLSMTNGILRKRFMRELTTLKRNADYSNRDRHGIAKMLRSKPDLMVYAYDLIEAIDSLDLVDRLSEDDFHDILQQEANINSQIHRQQIIDIFSQSGHTRSGAVSETGSEMSFITGSPSDSMPYDVYISAAGSHGSDALASLVSFMLNLRGFHVKESDLGYECRVDMDIDSNLDENVIYQRSYTHSIERCQNFVLVLGAGALDNCLIKNYNQRCQDGEPVYPRLYCEIVAALKSKNVKIIPVVTSDFKFPDEKELLPQVRALCTFNAVNWVHDYQQACVDKIERFIRGDEFMRSNSHISFGGGLGGSCLDLFKIKSNCQGNKSCATSGRSTPVTYGSSPSFLTPPGSTISPSNMRSNSDSNLHGHQDTD